MKDKNNQNKFFRIAGISAILLVIMNLLPLFIYSGLETQAIHTKISFWIIQIISVILLVFIVKGFWVIADNYDSRFLKNSITILFIAYVLFNLFIIMIYLTQMDLSMKLIKITYSLIYPIYGIASVAFGVSLFQLRKELKSLAVVISFIVLLSGAYYLVGYTNNVITLLFFAISSIGNILEGVLFFKQIKL